jgi:hypothetical protein
MYHALLFLHVLSAFFLAAGIVIYSSFALGGPVNRATKVIAEVLWGVGGLGTLVFGVWLALNRPEYEIYDGWIITAIVLWFLATGSGALAGRGIQAAGDDSAVAIDRRTLIAHWMRVFWFVLLLIVMAWKPGA